VAGQGVGIRREQHCDLGAGSWVEVVLSDQGDDLVTVVAPRECLMRRSQRDSKKDAREKYSL
jgi:hypothetical protein